MTSEPIRAAVISDTHGLLRPEVERILQSCDVVIHAGDFDNQMVFHKLKIKRPLYAVRGNNDNGWAEQLPLNRRFKLGNFRILLVHDQADIPQDTKDIDVVIFGHSHMHTQEKKNGQLWLNPGSCGYRRFTLPLSLAVLTLDENVCEIETFFLVEEGERIALQKKTSSFLKSEHPGKTDGAGEKAAEKSAEQSEKVETSGIRKGLRERLSEGKRQKDQLFIIARIMRLMKRGESVEWVAKNLNLEEAVVENIFRICITHPQADAHQILDKMEVNRIVEGR